MTNTAQTPLFYRTLDNLYWGWEYVSSALVADIVSGFPVTSYLRPKIGTPGIVFGTVAATLTLPLVCRAARHVFGRQPQATNPKAQP